MSSEEAPALQEHLVTGCTHLVKFGGGGALGDASARNPPHNPSSENSFLKGASLCRHLLFYGDISLTLAVSAGEVRCCGTCGTCDQLPAASKVEFDVLQPIFTRTEAGHASSDFV